MPPPVDRSFSERIGRESEAWVADGIVSSEQAAAIRSRYAPAGEESHGRATAALALIGAAAVGLGVIGFFAANWDGMRHGLRLLLLTLAVAGSHGAAYHLRERRGRLPRLGEALYLAGVLLFGASLFLVGQMYNVQAHDPVALLLWSGGATATALVVQSRVLAAVAVLIFTAWVGFEVGLALEDEGASLAGLAVAGVFYGGTLYGVATAAEERPRTRWLAESGFAPAGRRLGLPLAAGSLFVFTFSEAADELGRAGDELEGVLLGAFAFLAALALASAGALALTRRRAGLYQAAALVLAVVILAVALLAGGDADIYAILFNLLFAGVALGLVYAGYLRDERWLVNLGVLLVAVDLVGRYFDLFWAALPRSLGMIGAGVLVLAIAYGLERQRQRLLKRMDG